MGQAKRLIYRYDGDPNTQEVVEDHYDEIPVPHRGDLILRKGKKWCVATVMIERTNSAMPEIIWIFLKLHL
jgi:hypothetical protein